MHHIHIKLFNVTAESTLQYESTALELAKKNELLQISLFFGHHHGASCTSGVSSFPKNGTVTEC